MKKNNIYKMLSLLLFCGLFSCNNTTPPELGQGYSLSLNPMHGYTVFKGNAVYTLGDIDHINVDSTYIIVSLKPTYRLLDSIYKINSKLNYDEKREEMAKVKTKEYWIINKKIEPVLLQNDKGFDTTNVYGPFNIKQFESKRNELGVSDTLKLLNIEDFLEKYYKEIEK